MRYFPGLAGLALTALFAASAMAQMIPNGDHASFVHCVDGYRQTDERIAACTRTLSAGTGNGEDARYVLIELYARKHDLATAQDAADRMVESYRDSYFLRISGGANGRIDALALRGRIFAISGRLDDALKDAEEVFTLSNSNAIAYLNRCRIRALAGRELDLALADCNKALELDPGHPAYYSTVRGLVYLKLARFKDSAADFDATLDRFPKHWFALFLRGVAERRLGDTVLGDADIAKARDRDVGLADEIANDGVTP